VSTVDDAGDIIPPKRRSVATNPDKRTNFISKAPTLQNG
jgi:hypothetical protein